MKKRLGLLTASLTLLAPGAANANTALASWYTPTHDFGCQPYYRATTNVIGVANKTLPCGTKLTFYWKGRKHFVRVIDRGPYVSGRDFDLTARLVHKMPGAANAGVFHIAWRLGWDN